MTGHADAPDGTRRPFDERLPAEPWFTHPPAARDVSDELADGATWLLDLVSAVDHLRRGHRQQFTVWDALEEALRTWVFEHHIQDASGSADSPGSADVPWDAPDPLASTFGDVLHILAVEPHLESQVVLQQAVRRWVLALAASANEGAFWPHPLPRRSFPPVRLSLLDDPDAV